MSTFSRFGEFFRLAGDGLFIACGRPTSYVPHGVQHMKRAGHVRVHAGCLLNLDGTQRAVLFNDEADIAFRLNVFAVF